MKSKLKRILSLAIVIFLAALYLLTLLSAIFDRSRTRALFNACIFSTLVLPILLYAYLLIYRLLHKKKE